jgi:endonuclease/exonuclease/phosphatase family metal-dependent hydrolase
MGFRSLVTNEKFYVFNTHLDHKTREARCSACDLIDNKIQEICKDYPVYICGDFNAETYWDDNLEPLVYNYKCSLDKCTNKSVGTVCGFGQPTKINIDLCFYKNNEAAPIMPEL